MREEWRRIEDSPYEVSNLGNVRRWEAGKGTRAGWPLIPSIASTGYPVVTLCISGRRRVQYVHRLVARAFLGEPPAGMLVNHIDGDKTHSALTNLEYVTRSQNAVHALTTGLFRTKRLRAATVEAGQ